MRGFDLGQRYRRRPAASCRMADRPAPQGETAMRVASLAFAAALATGPAGAQQDAVSTGRALALQLCSGCHFVEAGQRVPFAVGAPPFLQLANDPAITDFHLRNFLRTPHPVMPMLILTSDEIDAVVAFILAQKSR